VFKAVAASEADEHIRGGGTHSHQRLVDCRQWRAELGSLSSGIGRRNDIFFYPEAPDDARLMQQWCEDQLQFPVDNPTYGLYSPTQIAKGAELQTLHTDRTIAMITGREPLSTFDAFVNDWRSRGGGLTRPSVPGSRFILMLVLFTLLFTAGIIPNYLLVSSWD
jgi:hypothetical protein